jgi:hypothetical protein
MNPINVRIAFGAKVKNYPAEIHHSIEIVWEKEEYSSQNLFIWDWRHRNRDNLKRRVIASQCLGVSIKTEHVAFIFFDSSLQLYTSFFYARPTVRFCHDFIG